MTDDEALEVLAAIEEATEGVIDAFVSAIDAHIEDAELADLVKEQAGINVMTWSLQALIKKKQDLLDSKKNPVDEPGTKDFLSPSDWAVQREDWTLFNNDGLNPPE